MRSMRTVASFWRPLEAYIVAGRLEAEGIPTDILDEHYIGINWMAGQALGGVKVVVHEDDVSRATDVLAGIAGQQFDVPLTQAESEAAPATHDENGMTWLRLNMRAVACVLGFFLTGISFPMPERFARRRVSGP